MLENVVQQLGLRAVLHQSAAAARGEPSSQRVHVVSGPLSHRTLLPRVSMAIHHGGAGTTAAVARAGVPQIIVPHLFDQFFFGERLRQRGVAPAPVPRRKFSEKPLKAAIEQILRDGSFAHAAQQLRTELEARNGITLAADFIESRYGGVLRASIGRISATAPNP
jgi:UDP:flavonoid glycosyltransferase YjiC (YdhE family)